MMATFAVIFVIVCALVGIAYRKASGSVDAYEASNDCDFDEEYEELTWGEVGAMICQAAFIVITFPITLFKAFFKTQNQMNVFTSLGLTIEHFSKSERDAQAKAYAITCKAKELLHSGAVLTIEAILPQAGEYVPAVTALVDRLCVVLQSDIVSKDADMVAGTLGRWGAMLTRELHGREHATLGDYVRLFETLLGLGNGKAEL